VVPLAVIVVHILGDRVPKRCLPDEDYPIQTFFFDGGNADDGRLQADARPFRRELETMMSIDARRCVVPRPISSRNPR
jgi:hypothetical protein